MKVVLMRRDKTEEYHRAKAENFVINDFLYQFDPNATLHQRNLD
jgi:hypothetical protein